MQKPLPHWTMWFARFWVMMPDTASGAWPAGGRPSAVRQRIRRSTQLAFFVLFLIAPSLNLLRFDLNTVQLWFLGQPWSLGIDRLARGEVSAAHAATELFLRGFMPGLVVAMLFLWVAYRWGRVYCGWLCPHFSVVELLNDLMHRACGRLSFWDRSPIRRGGRVPQRRWWPVFFLSCLLLGLTWSITLLTYLLPPKEIWRNLCDVTLTPNQLRFIAVGAAVFTAEFCWARHLFCRFGCAVGLFQSLAWMANPRGLVIAFDRNRARECRRCDMPRGSACDGVCPMRLHPRNIKRMMFSCVQCGQCLDACNRSQAMQSRPPSLVWVVGLDAVRETLHAKRHGAP